MNGLNMPAGKFASYKRHAVKYGHPYARYTNGNITSYLHKDPQVNYVIFDNGTILHYNEPNKRNRVKAENVYVSGRFVKNGVPIGYMAIHKGKGNYRTNYGFMYKPGGALYEEGGRATYRNREFKKLLDDMHASKSRKPRKRSLLSLAFKR